MSRESGESGSHARLTVRWARQGLDGFGRGPQNVLAELQSVVYATNQLERAAVLYVMAARDRGSTWAEIGAALGVTRQAARSRYLAALARRDAHRDSEMRREFALGPCAQVDEQRGVWEGYAVRVNGRTVESIGVRGRAPGRARGAGGSKSK